MQSDSIDSDLRTLRSGLDSAALVLNDFHACPSRCSPGQYGHDEQHSREDSAGGVNGGSRGRADGDLRFVRMRPHLLPRGSVGWTRGGCRIADLAVAAVISILYGSGFVEPLFSRSRDPTECSENDTILVVKVLTSH